MGTKLGKLADFRLHRSVQHRNFLQNIPILCVRGFPRVISSSSELHILEKFVKMTLNRFETESKCHQ